MRSYTLLLSLPDLKIQSSITPAPTIISPDYQTLHLLTTQPSAPVSSIKHQSSHSWYLLHTASSTRSLYPTMHFSTLLLPALFASSIYATPVPAPSSSHNLEERGKISDDITKFYSHTCTEALATEAGCVNIHTKDTRSLLTTSDVSDKALEDRAKKPANCEDWDAAAGKCKKYDDYEFSVAARTPTISSASTDDILEGRSTVKDESSFRDSCDEADGNWDYTTHNFHFLPDKVKARSTSISPQSTDNILEERGDHAPAGCEVWYPITQHCGQWSDRNKESTYGHKQKNKRFGKSAVCSIRSQDSQMLPFRRSALGLYCASSRGQHATEAGQIYGWSRQDWG